MLEIVSRNPLVPVRRLLVPKRPGQYECYEVQGYWDIRSYLCDFWVTTGGRRFRRRSPQTPQRVA